MVFRDRHEFDRALRREKGTDAKFCLAYRALLAALAADGIGLNPTMTPSEAAGVIREKTELSQIDAWTATFIALTYARDTAHATAADAQAIREAVWVRLEG